MNLEVVTIGDELLLGFTIDTNGAYLGRRLAALGVQVVRRTTVGDAPSAIAAAVGEALVRTGAVVTTGGLGPTADDRTKESVAALFGRGMHVDEGHVRWMRERWRTRLGREMPEANISQARVPDGARLLRNNHGSAPGIWLDDAAGRWVVMLPGVPREMRGMCDDTLLPLLGERIAATGERPAVVRSRTLRTTGIPESALAERVADVPALVDGVSLAYLPGAEGVDLRLTVRGMPPGDSDIRLAAAADLLRARVGEATYGEDGADLAAVVVDLLRGRGLTLAVGESCTGGMLGGRVTAIAGSSDVFLGGVIAYANEVKVDLLGVPAATIARDGAVSEAVAGDMARGACRRTGSTVGVGITGVAGPGGGSDDKPVGTVWIAIAVHDRVETIQARLVGDREEVRYRASQAALELLRRRLATTG